MFPLWPTSLLVVVHAKPIKASHTKQWTAARRSQSDHDHAPCNISNSSYRRIVIESMHIVRVWYTRVNVCYTVRCETWRTTSINFAVVASVSCRWTCIACFGRLSRLYRSFVAAHKRTHMPVCYAHNEVLDCTQSSSDGTEAETVLATTATPQSASRNRIYCSVSESVEL